MPLAVARLKSVTPYSQSKPVPERADNESWDAYEERIWRDRLHVNEEGFVIIPPMAFKNALAEAAKYLSIKIEGGNNATWTKHFEAGVFCPAPLVLSLRKEDATNERLYLPPDGKRGGRTRVWKRYPVIHKWEGDVQFFINDPKITEAVFAHHLDACGQLIGIGRFRPRNNGYYGRFDVLKVTWK